MATVDELIVEIKANTRGLQKGLDNVNRRLDKTTKKAKTSATAMKGLTKLVALVGVGVAAKSITNTIRMFEDLEATVQANTQSFAETAQAMKMIREFTAQTTFQVQEVTAAFIEFRRLGIKPTEEQLRGIGNVAAAQGRGIEEVASAVFKAGTTSIEGLQQLGATVVTNGDKLTITLAGVTKEIDKNTESVLDFISEIGNAQFGTAIADRAQTLTGAISNLGDASAEAAVKIGEGGLTKALVSLTRGMQGSISESGGFFEDFGRVLGVVLLTIQHFIAGLGNLKDGLDEMFASMILSFAEFRQELAKDMRGNTFLKRFADMVDVDAEVVETASKNLSIAQKNFKESEKNMLEIQKKQKSVARDELGLGESRRLGLTGTGDRGRNAVPKVKEITNEIATITGVFDSMADSITNATQRFTEDFVDGLAEGKNMLASFGDFAKDIVKQIISTFLQMAVVNKILNSVFSLTGKNALATFTPAFAGGGAVQAGRPTLVGERGAEIFVPNSSGRIMNNADSKSAMGGGSGVTVNQSINFSTGVVPTVRAEVMRMMPQISDSTKAAVIEASQRGGRFRKALAGA